MTAPHLQCGNVLELGALIAGLQWLIENRCLEARGPLQTGYVLTPKGYTPLEGLVAQGDVVGPAGVGEEDIEPVAVLR